MTASPEQRAYLEKLQKQLDEASEASRKAGIDCVGVTAPVTIAGTEVKLNLTFTSENQLFQGFVHVSERDVPRSELPVVFSNIRNTFLRANGKPSSEKTESSNEGRTTTRTTTTIWRSGDGHTLISLSESQFPGFSYVLVAQSYLPVACVKIPSLAACANGNQ